MLALLLPEDADDAARRKPSALSRRASPRRCIRPRAQGATTARTEIEVDARFTFSDSEVLQRQGFRRDDGGRDGRGARRRSPALRCRRRSSPTRRFKPDPRGAPHRSARHACARSLRTGGDLIPPKRRRRRAAASAAGRAVRHFRLDEPLQPHLPAFPARARPTTATACHTFLFGTRLTNVTRAAAPPRSSTWRCDRSAAVEDWSGGTRIGDCAAPSSTSYGRGACSGRARSCS